MKNESPEQCPNRITEEPEDEGVKAILAEAGRRMEKRNKNARFICRTRRITTGTCGRCGWLGALRRTWRMA